MRFMANMDGERCRCNPAGPFARFSRAEWRQSKNMEPVLQFLGPPAEIFADSES